VADRLVRLRCDLTDSDIVDAHPPSRPARELCGVVNCAHKRRRPRRFAAVRRIMHQRDQVFKVTRPHLLFGGSGLIVNIGSFWDQMGVKWLPPTAHQGGGWR
jgi:hypothetical protein